MKKSIIIAVLLSIFSFSALAAEEVSPAKKKLIDTLMEQTGQSADAVGKQFSDFFIQQMTHGMKQSNPDVDPKAFDLMKEEIIATVHQEMVSSGEFTKMMYPIYSKHFSEAELQKMIDLNNTEFGKKMIRVMPIITQEGMIAGQHFGQSLGPKIHQRVMERFKKEGIK